MLTNALSAKAVASLKQGKHRDGQGLQFEVKGGSRRWTFSYMFEGRQRELAIGKYPAISLRGCSGQAGGTERGKGIER